MPDNIYSRTTDQVELTLTLDELDLLIEWHEGRDDSELIKKIKETREFLADLQKGEKND